MGQMGEISSKSMNWHAIKPEPSFCARFALVWRIGHSLTGSRCLPTPLPCSIALDSGKWSAVEQDRALLCCSLLFSLVVRRLLFL